MLQIFPVWSGVPVPADVWVEICVVTVSLTFLTVSGFFGLWFVVFGFFFFPNWETPLFEVLNCQKNVLFPFNPLHEVSTLHLCKQKGFFSFWQ